MLLLLLLLKYRSFVVRLLGIFNNVEFVHDLIFRPGFASLSLLQNIEYGLSYRWPYCVTDRNMSVR